MIMVMSRQTSLAGLTQLKPVSDTAQGDAWRNQDRVKAAADWMPAGLPPHARTSKPKIGKEAWGGGIVMEIDYRHLKCMTDDGGMFQFAKLGAPDPGSGYTVDDNARALLVVLHMNEGEYRGLADTYLRFLAAAQRTDGKWCNWRLDGSFITAIDSDDSQGRAFLACCAASLCERPETSAAGRRMALRALPVLAGLRSPRAVAYALLGICLNPGLSTRHNVVLAGVARDLAGYLTGLYDTSSRRSWHWFEEILAYCNGIIPQALFAYYSFAQDRAALRVAREALGFLTDALFAGGYLSIVGNRGWWRRGTKIPCYDQQPVDACSMVMAYTQAFRATGDSQYLPLAGAAYEWYGGANINRISLYDSATGGCYDALTPEGVNLNQGAESLLSLLLSQQALSMLNAGQSSLVPNVQTYTG
jgi:hypothetical protein